MTGTKTTETMAEHAGKGVYGFTFESKLVRVGKKYYLIHDEWTRSVGGDCPRAQVYAVPDATLAAALEAFADPAGKVGVAGTEWGYFLEHIFPMFEYMGPQSRLAWAKNL